MYPLYKDIREKLGEPIWYDKNGVPRYCDYEPGLQGIYDEWDALFVIACQSCGKRFRVAGSVSARDIVFSTYPASHEDEKKIFAKYAKPFGGLDWILGWGDAPWHDAKGSELGFNSQCAGTTMNTSICKVLSIHHKVNMEWQKVDVPAKILEKYVDEDDDL